MSLFGLDSAVTSGSGLHGVSTKYLASIDGEGVPFVITDESSAFIEADVRVSALPRSASAAVLQGASANALRRYPSLPGETLTFSAQDAHEAFLTQLRTAKPLQSLRESRGLPGETGTLNRVGLPTVSVGRVQTLPPSRPDAIEMGRNPVYSAPGSTDSAVRSTELSFKHGEDGRNALPTTLYLRGTFSPTRLTNNTSLGEQLLSGYFTVPTEGRDEHATDVLGARPLAPSFGLGGLVQPAPAIITTLAALPQLETGGWDPSSYAAPISAIRVRVNGVTGSDEMSRERIRLAAERIHETTGLDVDVIAGSSPTRVDLTLPAGQFGRPELALSQWWLKKGVAVTILTEVDRKTLAFVLLVLGVSALSVANATIASVRARRAELAILSSLGWSRLTLMRMLTAELFIAGCLGGLLAAALSIPVAAAAGIGMGFGRALIAIPASVVVTLLAGLIPAIVATRVVPIEALRPLVTQARRPRPAQTLFALALGNVLRNRGRSALAALGLSVAVAGFTVLLAVTLAYQGAVVGSVLGDAVAVQARAVDYGALAAIFMLGTISVANVLYINIRERGGELATLRAVGWPDRHLARLVVVEGMTVGIGGGALGAVVGLSGAVALTRDWNGAFAGAAALAVTTATLLTLCASVASARLVTRAPTTILLGE